MTSLETQIGGEFQSPKSGKFESNNSTEVDNLADDEKSFNPLDRGNLNQIR